MLILLAHPTDTSPSGTQEEGLLGEFRAFIGAHFAPVGAQPLLKFQPHLRLCRCGSRAWPNATDQLYQ